MLTKGTALIFVEGKVTLIYGSKEPERFRRILDVAFGPEQITFLWPTEYKVVTQAFGINPQFYEQFGLPGHEGIDMRAPEGTKIFAAYEGKVVRNEMHNAYGWSLRTEVELGGETYEHVYAHFLQQSTLEVGQQVRKGQIIALADSTGNSTGSHLHFSEKMRGATERGLTNFPYDIVDPTLRFAELR